MCAKIADTGEPCSGCAYYPSNLPRQAYAQEDWGMPQAR